jgi:zinc-finger of transposase IS204/IS1001/IS1096/IS1165
VGDPPRSPASEEPGWGPSLPCWRLPPAAAFGSPGAACGAVELCEWLFPHLRGLYVEQVEPGGAGVVMQARSRAAGAACPACGAWSSRVHSGYVRTVADGPAGGRPVVIRLAVRRFLRRNRACERVTFAEQVDGADRPVPAAEPAASGVTGPGRARAGGPGRGPAGRRAGRRGAPDHAAAAGRRLARARDQRRAADPRGR